MSLWGMEWYSHNRRDGVTRHLIWRDGLPLLFTTRAECREAIDRMWGYIRGRPDLRAEPHGWRVPRAVRVTVTAAPDARTHGKTGCI